MIAWLLSPEACSLLCFERLASKQSCCGTRCCCASASSCTQKASRRCFPSCGRFRSSCGIARYRCHAAAGESVLVSRAVLGLQDQTLLRPFVVGTDAELAELKSAGMYVAHALAAALGTSAPYRVWRLCGCRSYCCGVTSAQFRQKTDYYDVFVDGTAGLCILFQQDCLV